MKKCSKCGVKKDLSEFHKDKGNKDGFRSRCKSCVSKYYTDNKEELLVQQKEYSKNNEEKIAVRQKKHYQDNKEEILVQQKEYVKNRLKTDINYRLARNLRSRLNNAIKGNYKSGSAVKDLGCSIDELKQRLQSQFTEGMNWDNHRYEGWHIDHIIPLSSYDLTDRKQFLEANHYSNLQPLWAKENWSKGNR